MRPDTGHCKLIPGEGAPGNRMWDENLHVVAFGAELSGLALDATQRCVYVSDSMGGCVRRVTLPEQWFRANTGLRSTDKF